MVPQPKRNRADDIQSRLIEACLALSAKATLQGLSRATIAAHARLPLSAVETKIESDTALPTFLIGAIDDLLETEIDTTTLTGTLKDRLFDIIMTRLDLLQQHRDQVLLWAHVFRQTPKFLQKAIKAHWQSCHQMLLMAGVPEKEESFFVQQITLFIIFQLALAKWEKDKTQDMAKTMALLDRLLLRLPKSKINP